MRRPTFSCSRGPASGRHAAFTARALAAAALAAIGVVAGPGCTGVLGLDAFTDAPTSLCTKLQNCYADGAPANCQTRLDGRLVAGNSADQGWLVAFSQDTCLTSCADARRCLDLRPVCSESGATCATAEECCDFIAGKADCVGGHCCSPRGVHCASDGDCCSDAGYCDSGYCGAVICREAKAACTLDAQCCSRSCVKNACAATICGDDGFECAAGTDCCSGHCEATGKCGKSCSPLGGVCRADQPCCAGVTCYVPKGADSGVCSTGMCFPAGVDCASDAQCCEGLVCDATFSQCSAQCSADGKACATDGECCSGSCAQGACAAKCSNAYCTTGADCCSKQCLHATCVAECAPPTCGHDVCSEGGPLSAQTCGTAIAPCVTAVCNTDPYCCCGGWDTLCIAHAAASKACTGACP